MTCGKQTRESRQNLSTFDFLACPQCCGELTAVGDGLRCAADGTAFPIHASGLLDLRPPAARAAADAFAARYRAGRLADGWRPLTAAAARALPDGNPPGFTRLYWTVRRESWQALVRCLAALGPAPLLAADLGAGFPWLSHRLAEMGQRVVAVDLSADADFGLGAASLYPTVVGAGLAPAQADRTGSYLPAGRFLPVLGDLACPPLAAGLYDAVICNASLHYVDNLPAAISRLARALRPGGALIVVDSPVARAPRAGTQPGGRVLGRAELDAALHAAGLIPTWLPVPRGWLWQRHRLKNAAAGPAGIRLSARHGPPFVVADSLIR